MPKKHYPFVCGSKPWSQKYPHIANVWFRRNFVSPNAEQLLEKQLGVLQQSIEGALANARDYSLSNRSKLQRLKSKLLPKERFSFPQTQWLCLAVVFFPSQKCSAPERLVERMDVDHLQLRLVQVRGLAEGIKVDTTPLSYSPRGPKKSGTQKLIASMDPLFRKKDIIMGRKKKTIHSLRHWGLCH